MVIPETTEHQRKKEAAHNSEDTMHHVCPAMEQRRAEKDATKIGDKTTQASDKCNLMLVGVHRKCAAKTDKKGENEAS